MRRNNIYQGDSLEVLKTFPDESIDCCISSPPYWALRDYGTASWEGGSPDCKHIEEKCLASNKNTLSGGKGDKTRQTISMQYKDICKKCGAKRIDQQLGLEPTFNEYVDKLCTIYDEVKRVLKKEGTCWVNLGDTYGGANSRASQGGRSGYGTEREGVFSRGQDKSLCQIPYRFSIEMCNRGWILRNILIWHKPNCMPSSVDDRFTVDFEPVFFFVKSKKYWFEKQYEPMNQESLARYNYNFTGNNPIDGKLTMQEPKGKLEPSEQGRNKRCVWKITTQPFSKAHFAVYPEALIEPMVKSGCPKDGIVLDPFMGAGTTAVVAKKLNRNYVGIELNTEYIDMANKRINNTMNNLF